MKHSTRVDCIRGLDALVVELSGERDALRLVKRAHDILAHALGATWSAVVGAGAPPLGELHVVHDAPADALEFGTTGAGAQPEEAVRVTTRNDAAALHVRRVDATRGRRSCNRR